MVRRALSSAVAVVVLVVGCSSARLNGPGDTAPGVTLPAHIAEGSDQGDGGPGTDGGPPADAAAASARSAGSAPDPAPLAVARQWEYHLRYDHGRVSVTKVRALLYARPVVTARNMGRYAIELWIGHELVDRVRFDFPVIAADAPRQGKRHPLDEPASLAPGAVVERTVLVPATRRPTRAVLVDRATGDTIKLPWPPDAPLASLDAGPPGD